MTGECMSREATVPWAVCAVLSDNTFFQTGATELTYGVLWGCKGHRNGQTSLGQSNRQSYCPLWPGCTGARQSRADDVNHLLRTHAAAACLHHHHLMLLLLLLLPPTARRCCRWGFFGRPFRRHAALVSPNDWGAKTASGTSETTKTLFLDTGDCRPF